MLNADHSHTDIERALVAFFYASSPADTGQRLLEVHQAFVSHFSFSEERFFPSLARQGFPAETLSILNRQQSELLKLLEHLQKAATSMLEDYARHSRELLQAWKQHDAFENEALNTFWNRVAQGWEET